MTTDESIWTTVDVVLHNEITKVAIEERVLFADKMNIFVLSEDPCEAAQMLCDKHVCKMSIEYAQLLLNAHHKIHGSKNPMDYKPVFINHPASRWVADSICNYQWLLQLTLETWAEYKYRFTSGDREHKCAQYLRDFVSKPPNGIPSFSTVPTPPPQCMPDDYRVAQTVAHANRWRNAVAAYREYYIQEKYRFAKWTRRDIPAWFLDGTRKAELDALTTNLDQPGPVRMVRKLFKEISE